MQSFLDELRAIRDSDRTEYSVDMARDICPQAAMTYLEKVSIKLQKSDFFYRLALNAVAIKSYTIIMRRNESNVAKSTQAIF